MTLAPQHRITGEKCFLCLTTKNVDVAEHGFLTLHTKNNKIKHKIRAE